MSILISLKMPSSLSYSWWMSMCSLTWLLGCMIFPLYSAFAEGCVVEIWWWDYGLKVVMQDPQEYCTYHSFRNCMCWTSFTNISVLMIISSIEKRPSRTYIWLVAIYVYTLVLTITFLIGTQCFPQTLQHIDKYMLYEAALPIWKNADGYDICPCWNRLCSGWGCDRRSWWLVVQWTKVQFCSCR